MELWNPCDPCRNPCGTLWNAVEPYLRITPDDPAALALVEPTPSPRSPCRTSSNPGGTPVEPLWNLPQGLTTPEPIWAEPKLSAVGKNEKKHARRCYFAKNKLRRYPQQHHTLPESSRNPPCDPPHRRFCSGCRLATYKAKLRMTAQSHWGPTVQSGPGPVVQGFSFRMQPSTVASKAMPAWHS